MKFVILGGGTAGWMAACLIAKAWPEHTVTVIESPEIGIIGVGEGSTPQLRTFFASLGIAESDWMPKCNATYKNGIHFHGWSQRPGYHSYFHPFQTMLDPHTAPQFFFHTRARRTGRDVWAHPDRFFLSARLAAERRGPIPDDRFPFDIAYGYHFDAHLVGAVLRDHAVATLGVRHLALTVKHVALDQAGGVDHLIADDDIRIDGDFFVDCSGFRSTILQAAMGEPFRSFASNLFNDAAVAMPTPNDAGTLPCETRATALDAGWAWRIPLTERAGNGYVYASSYKSVDQAETELRTHLGMLDSDTPARHLKMKVGRVERSWVKNCLAVGLSQGFIEPLEATALHIVQATVEGFIEAFAKGRLTNEHEANFNQVIGARYDGIRDYIVAHYRMNGRTDTDYWRANAANENLSDSLKSIMTCWFTGADLVEEIARQDIGRYYPALSWHCLLAGYGVYPDDQKMRPPELGLSLADMDKIDDFVRRSALNFPDHSSLLVAR
jgi:tryptophan 6-halogenase